MPPYYSSKQQLDISDLTDSDRFGQSDEILWPRREGSSFDDDPAVTVKHQHCDQIICSPPKEGKSLTSSCCTSRSSFDSYGYDVEDLRRSLQSDELLSTPTSPPPPPTQSPEKQNKAVKTSLEMYKELYEAMLHDVLDALEADDPSADGDGRLADHAATHAAHQAGHLSEARYDQVGTLDGNVNHVADLKQVEDPPSADERGLDPPTFMPDDLQKHNITIAKAQSTDSLPDSTAVIDFDESHDITSLISEINHIQKDNALVPVNKKRSTDTKSIRQPKIDDDKRRTSKSGGDRRRHRRPSSASSSKRMQKSDEKKRHEEMQRQLSPSKSQVDRFVRGRSPSPTNAKESRGNAKPTSRSKSPYKILRSISPFRFTRLSSTRQQNSSDANVSSKRDSSSGRERSLSSSRERPGRRSSHLDLSGDANRASRNNSNDREKRAKLFKKMKAFASSFKPILDDSKKLLHSSSASHKLKVGDMAEYNIGSRVCLEDLNYFLAEDGYTKMCVVRILEIGEDAVYEMPLYTILLPNGSKRQTNSKFLLPISKQATAESYHSRHQSALKSRNRSSSRSPSKHRSRSTSSESHRSNSSRQSTSSHRSPSRHHSRRSPSPHQSKSRHSNHRCRCGSNHHRDLSNSSMYFRSLVCSA